VKRIEKLKIPRTPTFFRHADKKVAAPPGSLVYTGEQRVDRPTIDVIAYGPERIDERGRVGLADALDLRAADRVTWINVCGLHDTDLLRAIGERFGLHPLVLEDIANTNQRPKIEFFDDYVFVAARMLFLSDADGPIHSEHICFVLGDRWVLTFQESPRDVFDPVRQRVRAGKGRSRKMGPDYLVYALLDAIVDNYLAVLDRVSARVEQVDRKVVDSFDPETLRELHALRHDVFYIASVIWPAREVITGLQKPDNSLVSEKTRPFVHDLADHVSHAVDAVDHFRQLLESASDHYQASVSNRLNDVMRVLTVIATIFVPLTFIVGVYGMNFDRMPELGWKWGYPFVLALCLAVTLGMLRFFKRRGWF